MKLHLPSRLRKALLACLAAMAVPSVPVTVASGSALVGGGAFVSFMLAQQAKAAEADDDAGPLSTDSVEDDSASPSESEDALLGDDSDVEEIAGDADNLVSGVLGDDASSLSLDQLAALAAVDAVYGDAGIAPYAGNLTPRPLPAEPRWKRSTGRARVMSLGQLLLQRLTIMVMMALPRIRVSMIWGKRFILPTI